MPLKGKLTQDEYNDDSKCFVIVNKKNQETDASKTHNCWTTWWLNLRAQAFFHLTKTIQFLKLYMGSFLAAKVCWSVSVLFFTHCQKIFCFGVCAFKGRTEILTKALFMSVFNCWLTTLFLHAGGSCWIIALAGRSWQWNCTPLPQSQITAHLKGLLLKDYWVSESQAGKKNIFFQYFPCAYCHRVQLWPLNPG